jgi:hypothetical protein
VLNWAPYGLYQDQSYHLLSAEEVADKKKLDKEASLARRKRYKLWYRATPNGKEKMSQYEASEVCKKSRRQYAASDVGKEKRRQYGASEARKKSRRQYAASDVGKEKRRQAGVEASAAGNKRARDVLEARDNGKRHAVQQKTNGPQVGLLGGLATEGLAGRELVSTSGVIGGLSPAWILENSK